MRATRVDASARPVGDCREQLLDGCGTQFDLDIVDTFLRLQATGLIGDLDTDTPTPEHV